MLGGAVATHPNKLGQSSKYQREMRLQNFFVMRSKDPEYKRDHANGLPGIFSTRGASKFLLY